MSANTPESFTGYQKFVIAILAFLQFTIILDFMIMAPLGAILMPALEITASQFSMVVSAYAFSAGTAGLLAAGFADKFDRKKLLLFFYAGFVLGTLFCGLAPNYPMLLAARTVTGLFGGVLGSIVFAITTDLFPMNKRGRVMGFIQTAFAGSQVLGIPAGLYFSNHWGWHAPFLLIVAVSVIVGVVIALKMRPVDEHLKLQTGANAVRHLITTVSTPRYLFAFCATALLSIGGFMIMPFSSAFTVHNVGIDAEKLPFIYLVTGLCSIAIGPLVGRINDKVGSMRTFIAGTLIMSVMVVTFTNLGPAPLVAVMAINVVMFIGIFSRMIPSQTLMSGIPDPASRGSFMSVSASLQQISGGVASIAAGFIVTTTASGALEHFERVGYVMVATGIITLFMMSKINKMVTRSRIVATPPAADLGH